MNTPSSFMRGSALGAIFTLVPLVLSANGTPGARYYPLGPTTPIQVDKENYQSDYMSLRGLEGVHVKLGGVINGAADLGLQLRPDLEHEVAKRLNAAGLRMLTEDEAEDVPGQPELAIYPSYASELNLLKGSQMTLDAIQALANEMGTEYQCCLSKTWASFSQAGTILRAPDLNFRMATWGYGGETWSCQNTEEWMANIVLETIDAFIIDYKKAMSEVSRRTPVVAAAGDVPTACHQQWQLTLQAFDTDSTAIRPGVLPIFDGMAKASKNCPEYRYLIEAHADSRASSEYNEELSRARAQSVKLYLLKKGMKAGRLETFYFGERAPLVAGDSAAAHEVNRRIVISPVRVH